MKRLLCVLLALGLLFSGCAIAGQGPREPVTFYYLRSDFRYGQADGVITGEARESAGHAGELGYLLGLYLMGPADESLRSPLPQDTRLLELTQGAEEVRLTLSDTGKALTESAFTLAAACLSLTVMELTGTKAVTIESGQRSVTMTAENLTMFDDSAAAVATEETT